MNIAIVNTADRGGGAESISALLRDKLRDRGHHVSFLAGKAFEADSIQLRGRSDWFLGRLGHRIGFGDMYAFSAAKFLTIPQIQEADIVHLHNLHGFYFGMNEIPRIAREKPVVWTFHDMWGLTGGCYCPISCSRWLDNCGHCPQHGTFPVNGLLDTTALSLKIKRAAFASILESGMCIGVSPWMSEQITVSANALDLNLTRIRMVRNCVDTNIYNGEGSKVDRHNLGIADDEFTILMSAPNLGNWIKGTRIGIEAVRSIGRSTKAVLILAGGNLSRDALGDLSKSVRIITLGHLTDRNKLAVAYRAANVSLIPSVSESFSMVMAESLCCGTPVVATNVGGPADHITPGENGELAEFMRIGDFGKKLKRVYEMRDFYENSRFQIQYRASTLFNSERFTDEHTEIYAELLHETDNKALERRS